MSLYWKRTRCTLILLMLMWLLPSTAMAAHPLITDDTGTQGLGKFLLEFNTEFGWDKETQEEVTTRSKEGEMQALLSVGALETVDLIFGIPYLWSRIKENGELTFDEKGLSDFSMEIKWRFWETEGFSFALKPGVTFPTGKEDKGLGTGKVTGSMFFITTAEVDPWAFHLNAGYMKNKNKLDEREDMWHLSLAAEVEVVKDLKLMGNIGAERNPDWVSTRHPAFILGGVIYSLTENLDIDFGVKAGLNDAETDYAVLAGVAIRF
ncbi:MAG: transporter [Thermodesulfobacteriota bacterium]